MTMRRTIMLVLSAITSAFAAPAFAQDDGDANRLEPYVALMGSRHEYDSEPNDAGVPGYGPRGGIADLIAGVNVPLGSRFFVGAEGTVGKGVRGDIDWEYAGAARLGVRMRDSGMIYGKVGHRWMTLDQDPANRTYKDMVYGAGFELAPGGSASPLRLRGEIETFGNFNSIRPSFGVVARY